MHSGQLKVFEAVVCLCAPSILKMFMLGGRGSTLAAACGCDQLEDANALFTMALVLGTG